MSFGFSITQRNCHKCSNLKVLRKIGTCSDLEQVNDTNNVSQNQFIRKMKNEGMKAIMKQDI